MFDDNGKSFVATLYNVLLAPDLCNSLFSIITLMNTGHTCLFHKGFCTMYFGAKEDNAVTLPHSHLKKDRKDASLTNLREKVIVQKTTTFLKGVFPGPLLFLKGPGITTLQK